MVSGAEAFRALHRGRAPGDPLVLPGSWDAASARVFAEAGFPALATPSHGVAASLGCEDGKTPADEMFADSSGGTLKDPQEHAGFLAEVRSAAGGRLFLNARVDVFAHGDGDPERAVERTALYTAAGAEPPGSRSGRDSNGVPHRRSATSPPASAAAVENSGAAGHRAYRRPHARTSCQHEPPGGQKEFSAAVSGARTRAAGRAAGPLTRRA